MSKESRIMHVNILPVQGKSVSLFVEVYRNKLSVHLLQNESTASDGFINAKEIHLLGP